jgi:AcrR family transcriptional regulator
MSSTAYELTGRTRQKQRTRQALLTAARELLARGLDPTVEKAADRAGISRTTAYRYFRNRRALLAAVYPDVQVLSLVPDLDSSDPAVRLSAALERMTEQILEHEPELRAQLRLSLEPAPEQGRDLPLRQGRAIGWLEDALSPLRERMSAQELRRLVLAIRATTGIESLVWLTDVAGLSRQEAVKLMRSSAMTLLAAALDPKSC